MFWGKIHIDKEIKIRPFDFRVGICYERIKRVIYINIPFIEIEIWWW